MTFSEWWYAKYHTDHNMEPGIGLVIEAFQARDAELAALRGRLDGAEALLGRASVLLVAGKYGVDSSDGKWPQWARDRDALVSDVASFATPTPGAPVAPTGEPTGERLRDGHRGPCNEACVMRHAEPAAPPVPVPTPAPERAEQRWVLRRLINGNPWYLGPDNSWGGIEQAYRYDDYVWSHADARILGERHRWDVQVVPVDAVPTAAECGLTYDLSTMVCRRPAGHAPVEGACGGRAISTPAPEGHDFEAEGELIERHPIGGDLRPAAAAAAVPGEERAGHYCKTPGCFGRCELGGDHYPGACR